MERASNTHVATLHPATARPCPKGLLLSSIVQKTNLCHIVPRLALCLTVGCLMKALLCIFICNYALIPW